MKEIDTTQINALCQDKLGIHPEHTSLYILSKNEWKHFTKTKGIPQEKDGWYSPSDMSAYVIKINEPFQSLLIAHEYVGHGLFFENHPIGRLLHYLNVDTNANPISNSLYTLSIFRKHFETRIEEIADEYASELMRTDAQAQKNIGDLE